MAIRFVIVAICLLWVAVLVTACSPRPKPFFSPEETKRIGEVLRR